MADVVLLNHAEHADLRVLEGHGEAYGDAVNLVPVFPTEFVELQREYPILFREGEDGAYSAVALLGFDRGENLFLSEGRWRARYVPGIQARGPFSLALRHAQGEEAPPEAMIHIDLASPRISRSEGHRLFSEEGGNTPYLEAMAATLVRLHDGARAAPAMFDALGGAGLIQPVALELDTGTEHGHRLDGFFTIDQRRFAELSGEDLSRLNTGGFLAAAFCVAASFENVRYLADLKAGRSKLP